MPGDKKDWPSSRAILANNARVETVAKLPTYLDAWAAGQPCLVPAMRNATGEQCQRLQLL